MWFHILASSEAHVITVPAGGLEFRNSTRTELVLLLLLTLGKPWESENSGLSLFFFFFFWQRNLLEDDPDEEEDFFL